MARSVNALVGRLQQRGVVVLCGRLLGLDALLAVRAFMLILFGCHPEGLIWLVDAGVLRGLISLERHGVLNGRRRLLHMAAGS